MTRSIFVSCDSQDHEHANGFQAIAQNVYSDLLLHGRYLLSSKELEDQELVRQDILGAICDTSVTVLLLSEQACQSDWILWELEESLKRRNGVVAVWLSSEDRALASKSAVMELIQACGAEVVGWEPNTMASAIERALGASKLAVSIASLPPRCDTQATGPVGGSGQGCNR